MNRGLPGGRYVPLFRLPEEPGRSNPWLGFFRGGPGYERRVFDCPAGRIPGGVGRVSLGCLPTPGYLGTGAVGTWGPDPTARRHVRWFMSPGLPRGAYAAWSGRRLPTTSDREYAAGLGFSRADGAGSRVSRGHPSVVRNRDAVRAPPVRAGRPNPFGIHDLHGLVWERDPRFQLAP